MQNKPELIDFLFLPDVSKSSGAGHFFRCFSLAKILNQEFKCTFSFLSEDKFFLDLLSNSKIEYLTKNQIKNYLFKICIFDTYKKSKLQKSKINSRKFIMINDYKKKCSDFDLSIYPSSDENYKTNDVLSGLRYSLIQNDFRKVRNKYRIKKTIKYILINFGFSDKRGVSIKVLKLLKKIPIDSVKFKVGIILGSFSSYRDKLIKEINKCSFNVELFDNPRNIYEILVKSDLVIGSGGVGLIERACVGVPSITFYVSENQIGQSNLFSKNNATILFNLSELFSEKVLNTIKLTLKDYNKRKTLSQNSRKLVDGKGCIRICTELKKQIKYEN